MPRWYRLCEWMRACVLQSVREAILSRLRKRDQIMLGRLSADVANVLAPAGYGHTAGNRADYGKFGYKHDRPVQMRGLPPVAKITGAQVHHYY